MPIRSHTLINIETSAVFRTLNFIADNVMNKHFVSTYPYTKGAYSVGGTALDAPKNSTQKLMLQISAWVFEETFLHIYLHSLDIFSLPKW